MSENIGLSIIPFADRIIAEPLVRGDEYYGSGLILIVHDSEGSTPSRMARILAVGSEVTEDLKVGDVIWYSRHLPLTKVDNRELLIVNEEFIVGVVDDWDGKSFIS